MKHIAVKLTTGLLTFSCGVTIHSCLKTNYKVENERQNVNVLTVFPAIKEQSTSTAISAPTATPNGEVVFGGGRLRIVHDEVHLKSERLRYEIDVSYPQIVGSEDLHIRKLNQRIKELATEQYNWLLNPTKADLRYYRKKWPGVFNSVDLDYEIVLATNSHLSIYFVNYSYGIGAAHSVQHSFVINYDLATRRELKLSKLFRCQSNYLEFISRYCTDELSKGPEHASEFMFKEALAPVAENFESWNLTRDGIRFNFDACKVFSCAGGEQAVEIPFTTQKQNCQK